MTCPFCQHPDTAKDPDEPCRHCRMGIAKSAAAQEMIRLFEHPGAPKTARDIARGCIGLVGFAHRADERATRWRKSANGLFWSFIGVSVIAIYAWIRLAMLSP